MTTRTRSAAENNEKSNPLRGRKSSDYSSRSMSSTSDLQRPYDFLPDHVSDLVQTPGQPLDSDLRRHLEPRFGRDFSQVRVHIDDNASASATSVRAAAYTIGNHIVFGNGRYQPSTTRGSHLLVHELTHVLQNAVGTDSGDSSASAESEANQVEQAFACGESLPTISHHAPLLSRFGDSQHHIIEDAALRDTDFTGSDKTNIHEANKQRDYSQLPAGLNLLLICEGSSFGSYSPSEHFDNFAWNEDALKWQPRNVPPTSDGPLPSPIDYIRQQLSQFANNPQNASPIGNVFHTIEDFFAHSNFIELTQKTPDYQHGKKLITGGFDDTDQAASLNHKFGSVADDKMLPYFDKQAERYKKESGFGSHTRMSKDEPGSQYFTEARLLAALVIHSLAVRLAGLRSLNTTQQRMVELSNIMVTIESYLRPPNKNNPWWERLQAEDTQRTTEQPGRQTMSQKLDEASRTMTVTGNQCFLSPLRNLELSRGMPLIIPFGLVGLKNVGANQFTIQAGYGLIRLDDSAETKKPITPDFGFGVQGSITREIGSDGKKISLKGAIIFGNLPTNMNPGAELRLVFEH